MCRMGGYITGLSQVGQHFAQFKYTQRISRHSQTFSLLALPLSIHLFSSRSQNTHTSIFKGANLLYNIPQCPSASGLGALTHGSSPQNLNLFFHRTHEAPTLHSQ